MDSRQIAKHPSKGGNRYSIDMILGKIMTNKCERATTDVSGLYSTKTETEQNNNIFAELNKHSGTCNDASARERSPAEVNTASDDKTDVAVDLRCQSQEKLTENYDDDAVDINTGMCHITLFNILIV